MENLYEYILEGLKNSPDFYNNSSEQTFENYLASLQESAKKLRKSYNPKNNINSKDSESRYSDRKSQAAYLIRYYPRYVQMTFEILQSSPEIFTFGEQINTCFFGAGPCPEVVGLAKFITKYHQETKSIIVQAYDIASDKWKPSRAITKDFVLSKVWKGHFSGTVSKLDLCLPNSFDRITEVISNCHLFVFQNCLNEIWNTSATQDNIKFLLDRAPLNSLIIIADLLSYDQNCQLIESIELFVNKRSDYQLLKKDKLNHPFCLEIPTIIEKNLLTGEDGLIPAKNINFIFLVIRKGEYTNKEISDDIF